MTHACRGSRRINDDTDPHLAVVLAVNTEPSSLDLCPRVRSRLAPRVVPFEAYDRETLLEILRSRVPGAVDEVVTSTALEAIAEKTVESGVGVRRALTLLRQADANAGRDGADAIREEHVEEAAEWVMTPAAARQSE